LQQILSKRQGAEAKVRHDKDKEYFKGLGVSNEDSIDEGFLMGKNNQ